MIWVGLSPAFLISGLCFLASLRLNQVVSEPAYRARMKLSDLVDFTNDLLHIATVPDYPNAVNGLQLENQRGEVTKIAASVDAHLPVVQQAVARGCDLLLVHHGIFWSGVQPITGAMFEKIKTAADSNLAIYSAHLPLDGHAALGNGVLLARALGLDRDGTVFRVQRLSTSACAQKSR